MTTVVEFSSVSRHYGEVKAVDQVSLKIAEGEFFSMLGPSGSGKTTSLRMIAGFEQPSEGYVIIHGHDATGLPPYKRDVNTVFQDYALFPHMNVLENIAYGLMVKGVAKKERLSRAQEALDMVALGEYGLRKPAQLSGGQRQRIALARALVNRPKVLLLDEPLGALDLKLREQMQSELKTLQRQLGITFIFVTHDQTEALSMSDRVAVFNKGRIEQMGSPRDLYNKPQTAFVAEFIGSANVIKQPLVDTLGLQSGKTFALRPEYIDLNAVSEAVSGELNAKGVIRDIQYQGANTRYQVMLDSGEALNVSCANSFSAGNEGSGDVLTDGAEANLSWRADAMVELRDVELRGENVNVDNAGA